MSEGNRAVVDRLTEEVFNQGNVDVIDELVAEDFVEHDPMPGVEPDREGFKQFISTLRSAFPDLRTEVEDQIAEGDRVVERWRSTATHQGEFMGVPATGKRVTIEGMDISRIEAGKIVEHWTKVDILGLMEQLGAIPASAPG